MGDFFVRIINIDVPGVTVLDEDGNYNVYINARLSYEQRKEVLKHELKHIGKDHFYKDISVIECEKEAG
jgi:Zn-dependent peptidase ImmA (M78 family)